MLAACAAVPVPTPLPPLVADVGCLRVAVTRVHAPGTVLEWSVANVCRHAVLVDLTAARVVAIGARFARVPLSISGPYPPPAPGYVDPGETTYVRIAYASALPLDATVEAELDDFDDDDNLRPITIGVAPPPPVPRDVRRPTLAPGDGASDFR